MGAIGRGVRSAGAAVIEGGLYTFGALIAAVVATIFLVAILLSPGGWKWWGSVSVHGTEHHGVVSYSYRGRSYSFDDVQSTADGNRTVYLDPAHPGDATLSTAVAQISDSVVVGGLYLVSVGFLGVALRRRTIRIRRHAQGIDGGFGGGIDPETVRRIVAARRFRP